MIAEELAKVKATVTALGETREAARKTVYANIGKIHFEGAQYRTDIASFENID